MISDSPQGALRFGLPLHALRFYFPALWPEAEAGRRVFTGGEDGLVRVWRLPDLEPVTDLRGHRSYVHALALAAGGRVLVSGGGDNTVRLWTTLPWSARAAADEAGAATRAAVAPKVDALFAGGNARGGGPPRARAVWAGWGGGAAAGGR